MNGSSWAVRQGREVEVTASSVLFIPPGGSTCTPLDSNSQRASAHGAARPQHRQLPALHYLSVADLQSVSLSLLSYVSSLACFFMHALIYTPIHVKPLIHRTIFVCDGVSKKGVFTVQYVHNSLRLVFYMSNKWTNTCRVRNSLFFNWIVTLQSSST